MVATPATVGLLIELNNSGGDSCDPTGAEVTARPQPKGRGACLTSPHWTAALRQVSGPHLELPKFAKWNNGASGLTGRSHWPQVHHALKAIGTTPVSCGSHRQGNRVAQAQGCVMRNAACKLARLVSGASLGPRSWSRCDTLHPYKHRESVWGSWRQSRGRGRSHELFLPR